MNELQIFKNDIFGSVRAIEVNGDPWFVAVDVCRALEIGNTSQALSRLDEDEKDVILNDTLGGVQKMSIVNEPGLYTLVLGSRKEEAKAFKRWITHEVIPSIRKNGGYIANQENLTDEQIVANALIVAQNIIADRDKQIAEMKPKVEFFEAVTDSKDAISMADVAKVLDFGGGRNTLFKILRQEKILQKDNRPYQEYIDRGFFRVVEQKYDKGYGETGINIKTLVFQKGVEYIRKLLVKREYI